MEHPLCGDDGVQLCKSCVKQGVPSGWLCQEIAR